MNSDEYILKFSRQLHEVGIISKKEYDKILKSLVGVDKRLTELKRIIEEGGWNNERKTRNKIQIFLYLVSTN